MARPVFVLIVEDHELLAQALAAALDAEGIEVAVLPLSADPEREVSLRLAEGRPAVVLLDLDLGPGRRPGESLIRGLVAKGAAVVVVTGATDPLRLGGCLNLGAAGVLAKTSPVDGVLAAVRAAADGSPVMASGDRSALLARMRVRQAEERAAQAPFQRLTPREAEVLQQLAQGKAAEAIAVHFVVSESTVRTQIRGILNKLGVNSQLAAVAEAHRVGWVPPQEAPGRVRR